MSTIDEVKQRTDIIEVISQYTTLTKAGRNFRALCPFHSEKRPSFFVYPEQQSWHCFGACNTGGDVFSFVMKKEAIDFGEALRLLAQRAGITIQPQFGQDTRKDEKERIYKVNEAASQYFHNLLLNSPAGEKAKSYVASRDITAKTITDFQLGYSPNSWEELKKYLLERGYTESELLEAGLILATEEEKTHDRFRNRLMFPIRDTRGNVTGFGARALDDSLPKYLNSPQTPVFDKSGTLYGINLATSSIRQQDLAVIVEGYMDVITAHQNGFSNVVASMGTAVTEKQVSTIKRLTRNIVFALDADTAGEEAMLRCVGYENSLDAEVKVAVLPKGKDPDDVIRGDTKTWQHLLEEALPVVDYIFNIVTSQLDLTTARDQSLAVNSLGPIITEIRNPVRKAHYIQKLARLIKKDVRTIEAALSQMKPSPVRRKSQDPQPVSTNHAQRPILSSRLEEECLALLLQHPELKNKSEGLLPEYFENTQNREIFIAWQQADDLSSLKDKLDATLLEHLDTLTNRSILATQTELRYNNYALRLREEYLKGLERKREAVFTLEAESGGTGADLAKLEEEGIEPSIQLREVFRSKGQSSSGLRR
ncbi:DNA primase [Chloroflexota bacterium]